MDDSLEKKHSPKYLSLEQVERRMPKIARLLEELQVLHEALELLDSIELEIDEEDFENFSQVTRFNKEFHKLSYQFFKKLEQLEGLGCVLKDLDQGIVDFFSRFEGREVFLCWKQGEPAVAHWHEIEEVFEDRRKIRGVENGKKN